MPRERANKDASSSLRKRVEDCSPASQARVIGYRTQRRPGEVDVAEVAANRVLPDKVGAELGPVGCTVREVEQDSERRRRTISQEEAESSAPCTRTCPSS